MFEIGLILFGAKRWISNFFKAVFGSPYFWLATGLIVSLWLAWGWHASAVALRPGDVVRGAGVAWSDCASV